VDRGSDVPEGQRERTAAYKGELTRFDGWHVQSLIFRSST
jgi:hypothetical protein